jgi:hypothetical protein
VVSGGESHTSSAVNGGPNGANDAVRQTDTVLHAHTLHQALHGDKTQLFLFDESELERMNHG